MCTLYRGIYKGEYLLNVCTCPFRMLKINSTAYRLEIEWNLLNFLYIMFKFVQINVFTSKKKHELVRNRTTDSVICKKNTRYDIANLLKFLLVVRYQTEDKFFFYFIKVLSKQ